MISSFQIFSPATIGNVASGFDVLGLCLDQLGDVFHFEASPEYRITVLGRDAELVPLQPDRNTVTIAAEAFAKLAGKAAQAFHVTLNRSLPLAGGLGSSAASSIAGSMAAARFLGLEEDRLLILKAALYAETAVAGPHLDNLAPCLFGGLTLVQDHAALSVYQLPMQAELWVNIFTPPLHIETKEARKVLPSSLDNKSWTKQMAHCATLALALSRGDYEQLSFGLKDIFAEPARGKLIPGFFEAQSRAIQAGAFGFSISGSGPSCFAFSASAGLAEAIARQVKEVFGPKTLSSIVRPSAKGARFL